MNNKSKTLFYGFVSLIVIVFGIAFLKYYVLNYYNLATDVESCSKIPFPFLTYYSHIPTALISLLVSFYIYLRAEKKSLLINLLLICMVVFATWSFSDLLLWSAPSAKIVLTFWPITTFLEILLSALIFYFAFVFANQKDLAINSKYLIVFLLMILLITIPTALNVSGFDFSNCEGTQGIITYYYRFLELLFFGLTIYTLIRASFFTRTLNKNVLIYFSFAIISFMAVYSGTNFYSSVTGNWKIMQFGIFSIPILVSIISYIVLKYELGVRCYSYKILVFSLVIFTAIQLFVTTNTMYSSFADLLIAVTIAALFWLAIYILAKNPIVPISWVISTIMIIISGFLLSNLMILNSSSINTFTKILSLMIIFLPVLAFNLIYLKTRLKNRWRSFLLILFYLADIAIFILAITHISLIKTSFYNNLLTIKPGVMFYPTFAFQVLVLISTLFSLRALPLVGKQKYRIFTLGILMLLSISFLLLPFFFVNQNYTMVFTIFITLIGISLVILPLIKEQLFLDNQQKFFDKAFLYKTIAIFIISCIYLSTITLLMNLGVDRSVMLIGVIIMLVISHTFYDWLITFTNDLVYNISSGLSVVTDNEIAEVIRNYNKLDFLETSPLLRLKIIKLYNKDNNLTPVDALKKVVIDAIKYFENPDEDRRTKQNVKYNILKMITFEDAEEGQILWELGFEEYPVKIMSMERRSRPPKFRDFSPADYYYTSRNAYLALKKEAIHDLAWRISYLEKNQR